MAPRSGSTGVGAVIERWACNECGLCVPACSLSKRTFRQARLADVDSTKFWHISTAKRFAETSARTCWRSIRARGNQRRYGEELTKNGRGSCRAEERIASGFSSQGEEVDSRWCKVDRPGFLKSPWRPLPARCDQVSALGKFRTQRNEPFALAASVMSPIRTLRRLNWGPLVRSSSDLVVGVETRLAPLAAALPSPIAAAAARDAPVLLMIRCQRGSF